MQNSFIIANIFCSCWDGRKLWRSGITYYDVKEQKPKRFSETEEYSRIESYIQNLDEQLRTEDLETIKQNEENFKKDLSLQGTECLKLKKKNQAL